jgi:hypothetical protein
VDTWLSAGYAARWAVKQVAGGVERTMTEEQWLKEKKHPQGMLWFLRNERKVTRTKLGRRKE